VLDLLNYLPALLAEASDIASMVKKFFPGLDGEQVEPVRLGHIDSLPAYEPELAECRVAGISSLRACPLTHAHGSQQ
jgi:hypothetical protein